METTKFTGTFDKNDLFFNRYGSIDSQALRIHSTFNGKYCLIVIFGFSSDVLSFITPQEGTPASFELYKFDVYDSNHPDNDYCCNCICVHHNYVKNFAWKA